MSPTPPPPRRFKPRPEVVMRGLGWVQEGVYIAVGLMLAVAGALVLAGTVDGLIDSIRGDAGVLDTGLEVLDRVLLLLIIAELLHTLRLVLYEGEIHAEPFLLIGLIVVVRRVVVITAEVEQVPTGDAFENFLLELGVLAALALAFGIAIYLLRVGAQAPSAEV